MENSKPHSSCDRLPDHVSRSPTPIIQSSDSQSAVNYQPNSSHSSIVFPFSSVEDELEVDPLQSNTDPSQEPIHSIFANGHIRPADKGDRKIGRSSYNQRYPCHPCLEEQVPQCTRSSSYEPLSMSDNNVTGHHLGNSENPRPTDCDKHAYQRLSKAKSWFRNVRSCLQALAYSLRKFIRETVWLKEILSLLVSIFALAAIVAVLVTYHDKPLQQLPSSISVNSLVSIFTSIFKAAMLLPITEGISELKWLWFAAPRLLSDLDCFDAASRGPLGSFKLFRSYQSTLACLGALIIIFCVGIDPFTQQILHYHNCLRPLNEVSAVVPRTNNYTDANIYVGGPDYTFDGQMTLAFYKGLLEPPANASATIPVDCQSGNCTFSQSNELQYKSLAMCSTVDDISDHIFGNGENGNFSIDVQGASALTLLSGDMLVSAEDADLEFQYYGQVQPVFAFKALMTTNKCKNSGKPSPDLIPSCILQPWAFVGILYPCIRTYSGTKVFNSVFEERVVSTVPLLSMVNGGQTLRFSLAGDYPSFPGLDCTPSLTPQGKKIQATSPYPNGLRYANDSLEAMGAPDTRYYDPGCVYGFGDAPSRAFTDGLADFFGSLMDPNTLGSMGGLNASVGDLWLLNLYRNGTADLNSASAYMQSLANSITAVIRQSGDATNSVPLRGTVLFERTCVRVQWAWLILPIALLLLTVLFCMGVAIQTINSRRGKDVGEGRGAWKSSLLPLLWCELDDDDKKNYGELKSLMGMKERAKRLKVRLVRGNGRDEEGFRFREASN